MTYLISDSVAESEVTKVTGKIGGEITNLGGKLLKEEIWKRRKLAYPIKKQQYATYVTVNFELPGTSSAELDREIRLTPQIIRHLILVRDMGSEKLSLTTEDIANTEAIEEVVGGEKSFEAVEGETEESRDLMAVREKEVEAEEIESEDEDAEEEVEETTDEADATIETEEEVEAPTESEDTDEETTATEEEPVKEAATEEPADEVKTEEVVEEKPKRGKKKSEETSEADRLAKLDKELDDILNDQI